MKKLFAIILITVAIVGMVFMAHEAQMTRNVDGIVVDAECDNFVVIEALGQEWLWEVEDDEVFENGQKVKLDFYDKGLGDFEVWEIVKIRG